MPRKQKGVNPLIATILLLLVCMAIGGIIWSWVQGFTEEQTQASEKTSSEIAKCSEASLTIKKDQEHCTFYGSTGTTDTNQVKLIVENTGGIDLNDFIITSKYTDGTSDNNVVSLDIEEYGTAVAWAPGTSPSSIPESVEIMSKDCTGISATVKPRLDCIID